MRVIFLEAVQNYGGARKSTVELAKRLKNNGQEVKILDFWGSCEPFIDAVKSGGVDLEIIDKRDNPLIISNSNKLVTVQNLISYFFKWIGYRTKVSKIISEFRPDIIVVNNTKTLSILSRSKSYKIAFFARGWFLPRTINFINKSLLKKMTDVFIGVSQSTRQAIFAGGFAQLKDIFVVPNAISENSFLNGAKENLNWATDNSGRPFVIMHCGGFLESKGQHITIDIAKELKKENRNFKILLVGIIYKGDESISYYNKILRLIELNNLKDNFEIVLNQSDVSQYFNEIDLLIHPSSTEGLPRVVMEAMFCGKPVIGNAVGGMIDYILNGYTGYLTNFNETQEYVKYCVNLEKNKELYGFMSNNAELLIKKCYTEKNQVLQFLNIQN